MDAILLIVVVLALAALWLVGIMVDRRVSRTLEAKWQATLEAHWAEWHAETVAQDPLTPEVEDELT